MKKNTMKFTDHEDWMAQRLAKNPKLAKEYLKVVLEDMDSQNNEQVLMRALRQVAKAQGISKVAKASGIRRESLSRALSERGNPRIDTLLSIVHALGLQLTVKPIPS